MLFKKKKKVVVIVIVLHLVLSNNPSDYETTVVIEGKFTTMQCHVNMISSKL